MTDNEVTAIRDLAYAAKAPGQAPDGTPMVLLPEGYKAALFPDHMERPARVDRAPELHNASAFAAYVNRFATPNTVCFVDVRGAKFRAYIDYHGASDGETDGVPNWCLHLAKFDCQVTPEWAAWKKNDGVWMGQAAFAGFIEDHTAEIREPDGAQMLEIALSLETAATATFRRAIRLDNGQVQFRYSENIEGRAGADGNLTIPTVLTLGIKLHEGGLGFELAARFRYRIKDGVLHLCYQLVRPHDAEKAAVADAFNIIQELLDDRIPVYFGAA